MVKVQGKGLDPNTVPDALALENLEAEHGRGIHLMKSAMDEVSFERGGTEVHMWKGSTEDTRAELKTANDSASRMPRSNPRTEPPLTRCTQIQLTSSSGKQFEGCHHYSRRVRRIKHANQSCGADR